ncbi:MAG TPA: M56 family metallopeptidase [Gemmatimonadales bacterium]|jgi:beta-lactamase regulating signal transducer with metallopeptidase domain|nr:M56 family metallopeptidase [Gemmatimonadales bacterium]
MIAMLADAFVKATIVLLLAAAATLLLKRSSAAVRHLVWALAFVGLLALPIASAVMPDWSLAAWPRLDAPVAFQANELPTREAQGTARVLIPAATATATAAPSVAVDVPVRWKLVPDWSAFVVPVWLGGASVVLVTLLLGLARLAWLRGSSRPVRDGGWIALTADLARALGIRRPVRLLQSAGPAMPMTWGAVRPVILLPADADTWPVERRRDVLLHELAHVRRGDFLTQLVARVACAVYWFHPLAWLAAGRLLVERERACDDHVLRAGTKPSAYASHLLEIARGLRAARATSLASVSMARPAQLATRLLDVLDANRRREVVAPRVAVPAWIAAAAIVIPLAALAPGVATPAPASRSIDTIPEQRTAVMKPKARVRPAAVESVGRDTLKGCARQTKHRSSSTSQENDDLTILVTVGGCTVRLDATGKFTFNEDYTDIASVAADARVVIEVDYGAHDYRLTIRPGAERVFKVDDQIRPFDAEAKAWLGETLTYLLRRTGYDGEARARWILERRGIQGLITEIGEISGDYARRIYYQAAIESGKLDVAGYERLVGMAASTIDSDYELAELLIAVSKAQPLTERLQTAFAAAAKTISSDYERHRVLSAALSRPGLTPAAQAGMLDAAASMGSDYELATLLIELNDARRIDDAVRPAFFTAANSVSSDYEHRRVLSAVVGRAGASRAVLGDALASAKTIGSDYELAELLTEIGTVYTVDDTLRPAFFAAAATISSDHEHARALASVLETRNLSRPVVLALLESAKGIQSDYELGELLLAVIRKVAPMDDTVRAAIRSAAATIGSQYDRGRVFEALP